MCDMDWGSDEGFDTEVDTDVSENVDDSSNMDVASDNTNLEQLDDVDDAVEDYSEETDFLSDVDSEEFSSLAEYSDLIEDTDNVEELLDIKEALSNGEVSMDELEGDFTDLNENEDSEETLDQLEDITPELLYTREELQELMETHSDDPDFGKKIEELLEAGRIAVAEVEEPAEEDGDDVKVLTREIAPEILASRAYDTEEVLDNYRENLRERGVSDEKIEEFIVQERDKIYAEYESLDRGNTSDNIYYMPTNWDATAEALIGQHEENVEISENILDSLQEDETVMEMAEIIDEGQEDNLTIADLEDIPIEADGEYINDMPESEVPLEMADAITEGDILSEEMAAINGEGLAVDELDEVEVEVSDIELGEALVEVEDIEANEAVTETVDIEAQENVTEVEDTEVKETTDDLGDSEVKEAMGEVLDGERDNDAVEELADTDESQSVEEMSEIYEEEAETLDERVNETAELNIDYDEIYEEIEREALAQGFEDINIYEDSERLDHSLEDFKQDNWEQLSLEGQKESIETLAEYVKDVIRFKNSPGIEYYYNPQEGDYGRYDPTTNTLLMNEYMLYNSDEAADTVAHELWHARQYERAQNPQSARDYQYQYNFENYIRPEMGPEAYENQLIEAEARAFAEQFKGRLNEIKGRSR